jgi:hypothetical protein
MKISNMEKEFVPHEIALALKELGFDESCFAYYDANGILNYVDTKIISTHPYLAKNSEWEDLSAAPLYQQAFRWFRENYNLTTHIQWNVGGVWDYTVEKSIPRGMLDMSPTRYMTGLETYEEAELECLRKLIEIVKEK